MIQNVCKALYAYETSNPEEVAFAEDDVLFILATLKGATGAPGLIPSNYVEQVQWCPPILETYQMTKRAFKQAEALSKATALFDYTAQNEEELSVAEGESLSVFDKADSDWWLVKNSTGQFGLVPATYVEEVHPL